MSSQLFSAKKLLIVPSRNLKLGDYLPFTVLVDVLSKNIEKVEVCMSEPFSKQLTSAVNFPEVKIIKKVSPRRFVLSFNKGDEQVQNIQWQQSNEKINIYISMDQGKFSPQGMNVDAEGSDYDTILFYGVTDYETVSQYFKEYPSLVHEAKNISFGSTFAIPHGKVELIRGENGETNAELVYQSCRGKGTSPEHYSRLLGSILIATKRFKSPNVRSRTFNVCGELMSNGASIGRANAMSDQAAQKPKQPGAKGPEKSSPASRPEEPKRDGHKDNKPKDRPTGGPKPHDGPHKDPRPQSEKPKKPREDRDPLPKPKDDTGPKQHVANRV